MAKVTICDPPSGWRYGFPKPIPDEVENLKEWLLSEGYPEFEFDKMGDHFYCRYWEVDEDDTM